MRASPLTPWFGEDVDFDACAFLERPDAAAHDELKALIVRRKLVRITGLDISPQDYARFGRMFGSLRALRRLNNLAAQHVADVPEIKLVSNGHTVTGAPLGDGDAGELSWHMDGPHLVMPTSFTFLYGVETPHHPPLTHFLDLGELARSLPDELRRRLAGLRALHYSPYYNPSQVERYEQGLPTQPGRPELGTPHPIVGRHPETGEDVLWLPTQPNCLIEGMDAASSRVLLDELWTYVELSPYKWAHAIQSGDLLIWDNRSLIHKRDSFEETELRVLWHLSTDGEPLQMVPANA